MCVCEGVGGRGGGPTLDCVWIEDSSLIPRPPSDFISQAWRKSSLSLELPHLGMQIHREMSVVSSPLSSIFLLFLVFGYAFFYPATFYPWCWSWEKKYQHAQLQCLHSGAGELGKEANSDLLLWCITTICTYNQGMLNGKRRTHKLFLV